MITICMIGTLQMMGIIFMGFTMQNALYEMRKVIFHCLILNEISLPSICSPLIRSYHNIESVIVTVADKVCAMREVLHYIRKKQVKGRKNAAH